MHRNYDTSSSASGRCASPAAPVLPIVPHIAAPSTQNKKGHTLFELGLIMIDLLAGQIVRDLLLHEVFFQRTMFSCRHQCEIIQTRCIGDLGEVDSLHRVRGLVVVRIETTEEECHRNPLIRK